MHCILMFYFYKQLTISDYTVYNEAIVKNDMLDNDTNFGLTNEMEANNINNNINDFESPEKIRKGADRAMLRLQKKKMLMKRGNPNEREFASNFCNLDGLCKYIIEKPCKIAILCRMLVMIFIFQVLNSSIEALPVIILYQSFGVSLEWMIVWFVWWISPILLLLHFSFLTKRYISIMRHPWKYYYSEYDTSKFKNETTKQDLLNPLLSDNGANAAKVATVGAAINTTDSSNNNNNNNESGSNSKFRKIRNNTHLKVGSSKTPTKFNYKSNNDSINNSKYNITNFDAYASLNSGIDDNPSKFSHSFGHVSSKSGSPYVISDKPGKYSYVFVFVYFFVFYLCFCCEKYNHEIIFLMYLSRQESLCVLEFV